MKLCPPLMGLVPATAARAGWTKHQHKADDEKYGTNTATFLVRHKRQTVYKEKNPYWIHFSSGTFFSAGLNVSQRKSI